MKPRTRIKKRVMNIIASPGYRRWQHRIGRLKRSGLPTVHYFHQVDDPYSHLAVQKFEMLKQRYLVRFVPHLVSQPDADDQGDSSRFPTWAVRDARTVAEFYDTTLPTDVDEIAPGEAQKAATRLSAYLQHPAFADEAIALGEQLWSGKPISAEKSDAAVLEEGNRLRHKLGHYLSGTFYFEGEWYWGVDRLMHLEDRLCNLGLSKNPANLCVPRPDPLNIGDRDASNVTLTYFPSLRSPYTAISFDRTLAMAARTGVQLIFKPVMPMVMRGVPLRRTKGLYILKDTAREAEYYKTSFGNIVDPIGEPVKQAFSLLPYMASIEKDVEYCGAYLKASWIQGIDVTTDAGLRQVVESCDVSWEDARAHMGSTDWQAILDANLEDMLASGLWGVPSFRVSGGVIEQPFCCWGQDRLWRVETEIARRAH